MLDSSNSFDSNKIELIKGGFPRIKKCDLEFIKKLTEKKPREFSNTKIMSIKEIIKAKKNDSIINLITEPNIFINKDINKLDINSNIKKINNISIDAIIGKK